MNADSRQLLLLGVAVVVPVLAYVFKRPKLALGRLGFTLFVQVFDTTVITNLPAGRIIGLLYLPAAVVALRNFARLAPIRIWLINFAYLVLLGIVFGFLLPWP